MKKRKVRKNIFFSLIKVSKLMLIDFNPTSSNTSIYLSTKTPLVEMANSIGNFPNSPYTAKVGVFSETSSTYL